MNSFCLHSLRYYVARQEGGGRCRKEVKSKKQLGMKRGGLTSGLTFGGEIFSERLAAMVFVLAFTMIHGD